jgi:hypothetical protein
MNGEAASRLSSPAPGRPDLTPGLTNFMFRER